MGFLWQGTDVGEIACAPDSLMKMLAQYHVRWRVLEREALLVKSSTEIMMELMTELTMRYSLDGERTQVPSLCSTHKL